MSETIYTVYAQWDTGTPDERISSSTWTQLDKALDLAERLKKRQQQPDIVTVKRTVTSLLFDFRTSREIFKARDEEDLCIYGLDKL